MSSCCIVAYCRERGVHKIPQNETRRAKWMEALKELKPGLNIKKHSRICPGHFKPSDYLLGNTTYLFLLIQ